MFHRDDTMKSKKFKFNRETDQLFGAILSLETEKECEKFFRDLCTTSELQSMTERWQIAQKLKLKLPYRQIADELKISTTTVTRVAQWLENGTGGYQLILKRSTPNRSILHRLRLK